MTASAQSQDPASPTLARNAIGLTEVLFQSITHMAPAVATAISIGAATAFAGGITPLALLFAMIAVLFTAYSMSELARHLPSAGGMYTYVGRGLGSFFGWMVAWAFAFAEPLIMPILLGGFGFYGAIFLSTYLGVEFAHGLDRPGARVRGARVVPQLSRHRAVDPNWRGTGPDRDRHLPGHLGAPHRQCRGEHAERLRPGGGWPAAGVPGDDLLPPGLHRLRGRRPTRRGDRGAAPDDPEGGDLFGGPRRRLLRLQHVRRDGLLRPGPDDRLPGSQRRRPVGRDGDRGARHDSAACS